MTNTRSTVSILLTIALVVSLSCVLKAEDEEGVIVKVTMATQLMKSPGVKSIKLLQKGTTITILPSETSNGFVYAGLSDGVEGWVKSADLQPPQATVPGENPFSMLLAKTACADSLQDCPLEGCTSDPSHKIDTGLNSAKNTDLNESEPVEITWADIQELQNYVDKTLKYHTGFGTSLTAKQRLKLKKISTSSGVLGEGTIVTLEGFITTEISPSNPNPHSGGAESCNCGLDGESEVDWHANIGPKRNSNEFQGVLIEITPRHRLSDWSLERLEKVAEKHQEIRITGQLMLDNVHKVRRNFEENKRGNPARFSVWEIHPVRSIEIIN
jgi:hypothetical protein